MRHGATIALSGAAIVLMVTTAAFAASGALRAGPAASDIPTIVTGRPLNATAAQATTPDTGAGTAGDPDTSPGTGAAGSTAHPAAGTTSGGAVSTGDSQSGSSAGHTSGTGDTAGSATTGPGSPASDVDDADGHEVVTPPVRDTDDEVEPHTPDTDSSVPDADDVPLSDEPTGE